MNEGVAEVQGQKQARRPSALPSPRNLGLPFFAYGLLKPGELAFGQIQRFVAGDPRTAQTPGHLALRDGLPLLVPDKSAASWVSGVLITFGAGESAAAYSAICCFEPKNHYRWEEAPVRFGEADPPITKANVLVGKQPDKGSVQGEVWYAWGGRDDPLFQNALEVVKDVLQKDGQTSFASESTRRFDWPRFFRIQMAYMLLWSVAERFTALAFGPALDPMERVLLLGVDSRFAEAFRRRVVREDSVRDARDPDGVCKLVPGDPLRSAKYYYQVRSNLVHRGKGTFQEGDKVRESAAELYDIMKGVLAAQFDERPNPSGRR